MSKKSKVSERKRPQTWIDLLGAGEPSGSAPGLVGQDRCSINRLCRRVVPDLILRDEKIKLGRRHDARRGRSWGVTGGRPLIYEVR